MSASRFHVDLDTVQRFDRPGPRYTSYPTAVEFHEGVGEDAYREKLRQADAAGAGSPLSLYAHLPFCEHRCLFCGCHVVITPHMPVAEKYLEYVKVEIDRVAGLLTNRREVAQVHWGGGTPTYFSPDQLSDLMAKYSEHFDFIEGAEVAIEVDPRVTSSDHLDRLVELGFNRLSMGVQDLTPEVQKAITRDQTYQQTAELMDYARKIGFTEGINLDLIYGLPLQRLDTFQKNLDQILSLRPDRVAVYSFAFVPWIKGHQKKMDKDTLPSAEVKLQLYLKAMERFLAEGYEPIGMRNFMG
jgi:oxygen-independent coproporphyrinogen-3 oxidase